MNLPGFFLINRIIFSMYLYVFQYILLIYKFILFDIQNSHQDLSLDLRKGFYVCGNITNIAFYSYNTTIICRLISDANEHQQQ